MSTNKPAESEDKPKWPVYEPPPLWYIQTGRTFGNYQAA